jgi:hypothetical protein
MVVVRKVAGGRVCWWTRARIKVSWRLRSCGILSGGSLPCWS